MMNNGSKVFLHHFTTVPLLQLSVQQQLSDQQLQDFCSSLRGTSIEPEMEQIRDQITRVLDKQGVLSRLKAELRASVFLAINQQDIRQGGIGLGSKSDATHRQQLAADPTGVLLLELVREFMQWSNLQFTQQVFEQEMQLGPAAALENLQQLLGDSAVISPDADQPLLLQLLKQVVGKDSGSWQAAAAAAARADKTRQQLASRAAGEAAADSSTPSQAAATAEAANAAVEASAASAAGELAAEACTAVAAGGSKLPSKSGSLLGTASVGEDSDLIGTQLEVGEEEEEQYATALLPKHHTSSSAGLEDEASSASSTYPVDTPRITPARPVRAASAAAAAATQQPTAAGPGPLPSLRPPGVHPPLPPLAAVVRAPVAAAPVASNSSSHAAAADWAGNTNSNSAGGMAGACEMSESFGHDRSFGDSSLELQGLDSPSDRPAAGARTAAAAAASAMGDEASYSSSASSRSSSRGGGSRPLSPAEGPSTAEEQREAAAGSDHGVQAAAGQHHLPTVRPPGKLVPLPPVGSTSGSGGGAPARRNSEGLRDELLRSGLLAPQPPATAAAAAAIGGRSTQQLGAEASSGDSQMSAGSSNDGEASEAVVAGLGAEASDAGSNSSATRPVGRQRSQGRGTSVEGGGGADREKAGEEEEEDSDGDDDFGARGQQLLQAARRQLSNWSGGSLGLGQQPQQQQQGQQQGQMHVEVSGASLTLTSSVDLDDELIPGDISLPLDALLDGSEYLFEPAPPPPAAVSNAWASGSSTRPGAGAAGGMTRAQQMAQQALELSDDEDSEEEADRAQPIAAGAGFDIDEDEF